MDKYRTKPGSSQEVDDFLPERAVDLKAIPLLRVSGRQTATAQPMVTWFGLDLPLVALLQKAFDTALSKEPMLEEVVRVLQNSGMQFGVLGGWVRDHVLSLYDGLENPVLPRDIDLVVANTTHDALAALLPHPVSRTIFGGFTFAGTRADIDLWAANDTFLTGRLGLPSDLAHVLAVTDFNINAIVFLPSQGWPESALLDGGALESLTTRTISFHFEYTALPVVQIARMLTFSLKLGFVLDGATKAFIRAHCINESVRAAVRSNLAEHNDENRVTETMRLLESVLSEERSI